MVSHRRLQAAVEAALRGPRPEPHHRADLAHALHICSDDLKNFLLFPGPKAEDRQQVLSKEVRLPNAPPTVLDDQDAEIALKLSNDYHINEVDCVSLMVAAHQEWNLLGREPLEVLRLAAGLWFTERRALITSVQLLLRAVVLDEDLDPDFVVDIRQYLESLLDGGFRKRLILLIKEINREEPAGSGGPGTEPNVLDARGSLVHRRDVAQKERLSISQCLVFSCLIVRLNAQEVKDLYSLLKDCSADANITQDPVKLQVAYTIMFSLVISLMSDALGGGQEVLSSDSRFRQEFQQLIMDDDSSAPVEGFTSVIRLVWAVFLMLTSGPSAPEGISKAESNARTCLDWACEHNAFQFLTSNVLKTAAFQNDDEDLIFMYNAYLHKLITSFFSHPLGHEKIKDLKDLAMIALDSYMHEMRDPLSDDAARVEQQGLQAQAKPFISFLDLISEVYQREPELTLDNDLLWNFVRFAGEDHTTHLTLVAFLNMLTSLASNEDTGKKVYQLLQNKMIRGVGWQILFNSLNLYDSRFNQILQSTGALLPVFRDGDARALEAYLRVLKKVMEVGDDLERSQWFPDIEPLFKLLQYENVPPFLKGALRNVIAVFVQILPMVKGKVWRLLEQYDLPVQAAPVASEGNVQQLSFQAYDMTFELNEVEARQEEYPSTLSYLELLNVLIVKEEDNSDRGRRYVGMFRFVRDQVFAPFAQRAYADTVEKWKLVVAALTHFQTLLSVYQLSEEEIRSSTDHALLIHNGASDGLGPITRLPTAELMKDFMSGKVVYRNIMSILMLGVNTVSHERISQLHGPFLEDAIQLCLQIFLLALTKDGPYAEHWRPVYQPIVVTLSHDIRQIITLLEYVRYDMSPKIQQISIQIMGILSSRLPQLVSVILETGSGTSLVEDYAACLESRSLETQAPDSPDDDTGSLILRLLIENLDKPAPNVSHLLLRFDVDQPVERTVLQPKRHFSCLRVILDILNSLSKREVNAGLHELGFQLMYELCVDGVTSAATVELLRSEKYNFFAKHLDAFASEALPARSSNHPLRVSSLQQRAWLLKLLALELHVSDMDIVSHRDSCRRLLSGLFLQNSFAFENEPSSSVVVRHGPSDGLHKIKVLQLLDMLQFPLPDTQQELPLDLQIRKEELKVDEILDNPATIDEGGVYHLSERGDRLIDLAALGDALWQVYRQLEVQYNLAANGQRQLELREAVQKILRWAWRRNKNFEEQAAQLHMLVGWAQLAEVALSRRFEFLSSRSQILYEILDACLTASIQPDCSLGMALTLSQVVMTTMAKLQEQSMVSPGEGESTDDVTYMDLLSTVRLSNSACHTILSKLIAFTLRPESSEFLRRRQYATILSYLHYCQGMVNRDLPLSVMRTLLLEDRDGEEDVEIEKLDRDQSDLAQINFSILKREATALVDVVVMDATHGSEVGKSMAYYVLDALLGLDQQQAFLSQLQSRGLLQSCLTDISTNSYQAVLLPSPESVRRLYTLESEMALLLRVGYHTKKRGAQALFAMGALRHLSSCRALNVLFTEESLSERVMKVGIGLPSLHERQHQIVAPVLRLILCFTALVDTSASIEKGQDEVVLEIIKFVKEHHGLLFHIMANEDRSVRLSDLEEIQLVTSILSKVWPCEDALDPAFTPALFSLSIDYFCENQESRNRFVQHICEVDRNPELSSGAREISRKMELLVARVRCNLISFLYSMVTRRGLQLAFSNLKASSGGLYVQEKHRHPTLDTIASLLQQTSLDLESALEEKALLLAKLQDVNELSRHEADDIIKAYGQQQQTDGSDNIRKRRYLAMVEMCSAAGSRECQVASLVFLAEQSLEILYIHFDDRSLWPQTSRGKYELSSAEPIPGKREEVKALCEKLLPVFERLEAIHEERVGRSMKHIQRLVGTLKSRILLRFPSEVF